MVLTTCCRRCVDCRHGDARAPSPGLDALVTEARAEGAADHDLRSTLELVELMAAEDATVPRGRRGRGAGGRGARSTRSSSGSRRGGRLIYVGAGTSGRIARARRRGVRVDLLRPARARSSAIVAGDGLATAAERDAAEDDAEAGAARDRRARRHRRRRRRRRSARAAARPSRSARSGRARRRARSRSRSCPRPAPSSRALADHEIAVVVGPEFVAGSTRLKAGTAQKLVLNTISTIAMIRLGKTYGDLMVDVTAHEREAPGARRGGPCCSPPARARPRSTPRSPRRAAAPRWRSSRSSPASTRTRRGPARGRGRRVREALA